MRKNKILSVLLVFTMLLSPLAATPAAAANPSVGVHVANRVDVALAVGPTYVDFSNFEADLRAALAAKPHPIPPEDLFITAARAVNTNSTSTFKWWVYDHTKPLGTGEIDHNTHSYIELDIGGDSKHPYLNYERHMMESNNGATMDFYGYPAGAYTDFRFLPNDQQTKKTFEFAIEELEAYDALDGVGFLFNLDIQGTYAVDQTMRGYLLFLEYNSSGQGTAMKLYKLNNLNTAVLHHDENKEVIAKLPDATLIASAPYSSTDKYRRIKIEARPGSMKVWYNGSTGDKSVLTTKIAPSAVPLTWTTTGAAESNQQNRSGIAQVRLDRTFLKSFGFGPLSSYRSHRCAQPTHIKLQNLSMDMEIVRKLPEVVREPEWNENTLKYLVNLNEDPIDDFSSNSIAAELLARLTTDDIYYMGWCGKANAVKSEEFLGKHSLKGSVINIDDAATDTYEKQIAKIADEIYKRYWQNNAASAFLVTDNVFLDVTGVPKTNTADAEWPEGKWKVVHHSTKDLGWDEGTEGTHVLSGQFMSDLDFRFYLPGTYDIYYRDALINTVTAHRAPSARLKVDLTDKQNPKFSDAQSFDPDDRKAGIVKREYSWIDVATMTQPVAGLPGTLQNDHTYLVTLTVTDKHGAQSSVTRQLSGGYTDKKNMNPPYSYFTLEPALIIKNTSRQSIDIVNGSYDLYGDPITKYDFQVEKDGKPYTGLRLSGDAEGAHDVSALPVGKYRVSLAVTSAQGTSQTFVRAFEVLEDTTQPSATASPAAPSTFTEDTIIHLAFSDKGGSGFKDHKFSVSDSQTPGNWSAWSPASSRAVFLSKDGTNFIHWDARDNAGNSYGYIFGPYTINKNVSAMTLSAQPAASQSYGGQVALTAEMTDTKPYDAKSRVYFYEGATPIGSALISNGKATVSYKPDSAKSVVYEARFHGDSKHKASTATLSYTITKSDNALVTIGTQTSREYDGLPFNASHISVTGARSYKVEYKGRGGANYPLSATPPVDAGSYEVVVTTTDPDFSEKIASAPFEINPRQPAVLLNTDLPSGQHTATETVRLTAAVSNVLSLPPGKIIFSVSGADVAEAVLQKAGNDFTASADWTGAPAGTHDLMARYVPAATDNYAAASGEITGYKVTKAQQSHFSFSQQTVVKTYGDPDFRLAPAAGGQGKGAIDYYLVAGDTIISFYSIADDVSILQAGSAVLRAYKNGDSNYNPIAADMTVIVQKKANTLTINVPDVEFGTPVTAVTENESGGLLTYSWQGRGATTYGP
ncbi:MAG: Ig-like domain repeat protein, partial [Gracilibacteraceae bacterium]|nr:Ig-like domain repeat protein [Gracilibacteraceae bacterium]